MNDPDADGQCLLIMATSIKKGRRHDESCCLSLGCHPFIRRPTYMLYRLAMRSPATHIGKMVDKALYSHKSDVSQLVYDQIRNGLYASDETPLAIVKYARKVRL